MSATATDAPPLLGLLSRLEPALKAVQTADPTYLSSAEKREALTLAAACGDLLKAVEVRLLATASLGDDACAEAAYRTVVDLHAHCTLADRSLVARDHRLGEALERRWLVVAAAVRAGACSIEQARAIVRALDLLPNDLPDEAVDRAEQYLVSHCDQLTPDQLRRLGRGVLEYVAPEVADEQEAQRLARDEARARQAMSVHIRRHAEGITGLSQAVIKAPDVVIDRLVTYLDSWTSPRRPAEDTTPDEHGERVPHARKRAHAFMHLLEALESDRLPIHGGDATSLIVTISLDQLRNDLGTAEVIGGDKISAREARRLACTANVLPLVLGSESQPLDLGRAERLYTRGQRKAMAVRDRECRTEGCTIPATWCEAHHKRPWSEGGPTDIDDGALLCSFHHIAPTTTPMRRPGWPAGRSGSTDGERNDVGTESWTALAPYAITITPAELLA